MSSDSAAVANKNEQPEIIYSSAILTTHYLFKSFSNELLDDDVLKIVHLDCFDSDEQVVHSALNLLKKIGSPKSYPYLFNIIKEYPDERKIWALETLYHIGSKEVVTPLLDFFKVSYDENIKSYVLKVLARVGKDNDEVKDIIYAHTKDELHDSPLRFAAIEALSDLQDVKVLQEVVESNNNDIKITAINSMGKVKNIDSIHLVKRLCGQFKKFSFDVQMALIKALIGLENDYALELIKTIFQEGQAEQVAEILDLIQENAYFQKLPIRVTKTFLRIPEGSEEIEEKIINAFINYYESFPSVSSKVSQEVSESIEGNLRSYFAKFKVNYQKEYKANLSLKTKLEKDLFYSKEFLEKFADEDFVTLISHCLKTDDFNSNDPKYKEIILRINAISSKIQGDYFLNVKALSRLLESKDKLERNRVAAYLNTVDFKKKHHISRLHRILSFVSITKNLKARDVSYEIFRWGLQLQDRKLIRTAVMALGRSGHKALIREAEKTLFPMENKKIRLVTLMGLGELGNKDSISIIVEFFKTIKFDEDIYLATIDALKKIGLKNDRTVLENLLWIFIKAPSDTVKYNAAIAFAHLSSDKMIPTLAKYKDSKNEKIRELLLLMIGKLHELNPESGKEMIQNFYYSMLKDPTLSVKITALLMLYRFGDLYSIEVLKDLFQTANLKELADTIMKTIEIDSLDKIYWLVNLLKKYQDDEIQRSVSIALVSLLEGESKNKKTIADITKDFRLKPFVEKSIEEIGFIKEAQLDLSKAQDKEKYKFDRENTKEMTILFIDITGYTKKSSTMELMEIMSYLKNYEEMVLPIFKTHYGKVVKKMGDGLMLSFPLPIYGALAGIRLQEKLHNYNLFKTDKEKIITRVGLNTGSVAIRGEDLFGDTVNVASRMETKAKPGGVLVSEATFLQIKDYVTFEDMGPTTVKGKDHPIHTFHLLTVSASLPPELDPLISGDSALKKASQVVQADVQSEIEKIKTLISLDGDNKNEIAKKLLYNYRILYKTVSEIKEVESKEKIATMLIKQWHELKGNYFK